MGTLKVITKTINDGKILLPAYPSTSYLVGHSIDNEEWIGEEKVDGANLGMMLLDDNIILRNRDHILRKGYFKNTPAKKQFLPAWNWAVEHKKDLMQLNWVMGESIGVYGEWCYAAHGIAYTELPTLFIAFDVYVPSRNVFLGSTEARLVLSSCGFHLSPIIYKGKLDLTKLDKVVSEKSIYSNEPREGIYLKKSIDGVVVNRLKYIRPDYIQGALWDNKTLIKQKVLK